jgi:peptidoglycan/xylan/chitin deacetylase (PgdA/CDA1 family)
MPILIWFDDALKTTHDNAFPLLEERGFIGTESAPTSLVSTVWTDEEWRDKQIMTKQELLELVSAGWEITSHSSNHPHWTNLSR